MGLAKALTPPVLRMMAKTAKNLVTETRLPNGSLDGEYALIDEGPDDLWPEDPADYEKAMPDREMVRDNPDLVVTKEWGLLMPGGEVHWGAWQGISFAEPLERVKMITALVQTAKDIGFATDQVPDFLQHYGWVTRNQIARVAYEDTGAYSLTDPTVSAVRTLNNGIPDDSTSHALTEGDNTNAASAHDPLGDFRSGPVGGDEG